MNYKEAYTRKTKGAFFVGDPIRHSDCLGLCVEHSDGDEVFCETVAEVLPTTDDNETQKIDAAVLSHACNVLPDVLDVLIDAREALLDGRMDDLRGILCGDVCTDAIAKASEVKL